MITPRHSPSYKQGFARSRGDARYPGLRDGLVGLWLPALGPTGLTLRDISGYGNHGTLTGMDPATDWVVTEKGWTLDCDGVNDYVVVDVPFTTSSPWTLICHFRLLTVGNKKPFGLTAGFGADEHMAFGVETASDEWKISSSGESGGSSDIKANTNWHQGGLWWDGTDMYMSLDGDELYSVTPSGSNWQSSAYIGMGQCQDDPAHCQISGVVAYDRVLTLNEIQHLYVDPLAMVRQRARVYSPAVAAPAGNAMPMAVHHYMMAGGL